MGELYLRNDGFVGVKLEANDAVSPFRIISIGPKGENKPLPYHRESDMDYKEDDMILSFSLTPYWWDVDEQKEVLNKKRNIACAISKKDAEAIIKLLQEELDEFTFE